MSYMSAQEIRDVMHEQDSDSPPETPIDSVVATSDFSIPDAEDDYLYRRAADAAIVADEEKRKLINDEDLMSNLRFYMHKRFDDDGKQELDESDEAFYDRYMTHFRWMTNNSVSMGKEIDFMRKAAPETRQAFGKVYERVENDAPTLTDMSAGEAFSTLGDYVYSMATDPLNVVQAAVTGVATGGIGAVASLSAKRLAQKELLKRALAYQIGGKSVSKHRVRGAMGSLGMGAASGALEDAMIQELEQQGYIGEGIDGEVVFDASVPYEDRKSDINSILASAGVGAVLGAGEGILLGGSAKKQAINYANQKLQLNSLQGSINSKFEALDIDGKITDAVTFNPVQGDVTNDLLRELEIGVEGEDSFNPILRKLRENLGADEPGPEAQVQAAFDFKDLKGVGDATDVGSTTTQSYLNLSIVQQMDKFAAGLFKTKVDDFNAAKDMGLELTDDVLFTIIESSKDKQAKEITEDLWRYVVRDAKEDDWLVVERALEKSGLNQGDFLTILERIDAAGPDDEKILNALQGAFKLSKSNAGRILQSGSVLGKAKKEFFGLSKDEKARLNKLFGAGDSTTSAYTGLYDFFQKAGRVRRGLMVINPATTVRNVFSGATGVTFNTGANTIESILYHMGKTLQGDQSVGKSLNEIWLDSTNLLTALIAPETSLTRATGNLDVTRAKVLADAASVNTPSLARRLFRSNANFDGDGSLPGFVTALNSLNIAQDAFFRRSLFSYELDKGFRRAGIEGGLEGVLKANKTIPTNILEEAGAATMKGTFSYAPRRNKGQVENVAAVSLDFIEKIPLGTVAFPFARFMYNAMAFQLKYSPLNFASNAFQAMQVAGFNTIRGRSLPKLKALQATKKSLSDKVDKTPLDRVKIRDVDNQINKLQGLEKRVKKLTGEGADKAEIDALKAKLIDRRPGVDMDALRKSFASSTVGTAAIMGAMKIRSENQDQPYYNMRVGDTIIDTRALFPLTPYLMVADLLLKTEALGGVENFNAAIDPDKIDKADVTLRELGEGLAGLNLRSAAVLPLFDAILQGVQTEKFDSILSERRGQAVGKIFGEYANSFLVGTNFVKDVLAAFDSQEAMRRDYNAAIEGTGGMERGLSAVTQTMKKVLPVFTQEALGLEKAPARSFAYREPGEVAYRESALLKQTTGATTVRKPSDVEVHMGFLGEDEWVAFRSSGDKTRDNYLREGASQFASGVIQNLMNNDVYKDLPYESKRVTMNSLLVQIRKEAAVVGEVFNQRALAAKYNQVVEDTEVEIKAIINKDNGVTDANENSLNTLLRKQLLYKNYQWTGPFARYRWTNVDKDNKAIANKQFKAFADNAQQKQNRGEELSDYERLLLLAPRPTVESSGLYGLGHILAKELARSLKP